MIDSGPLGAESTPLVTTSVAQHIYGVCDNARQMGWNGAIVGRPGIGKSFVASEYARSHPRTEYISLTQPKASSYRSMLKTMLRLDWRDEEKSISTYSLDLKFRNLDFKEYLFILDEAQLIPLDVLRALLALTIAERTDGQITIVFCGNDQLLQRKKISEEAFAQIDRRVDFRANLRGITDDDADMLANAHGVEGMDAYQLCRRIGAHFQADGIAKTLELARRCADRSPINIEHIRSALDVLTQYRPPDVKRGRK